MSGRQLDLFAAGLPRYLYAADDFAHGLYRWPKVEALTKRFVEANPGKVIRTLTYDIDRPGAAHDWTLRDAPAPASPWRTGRTGTPTRCTCWPGRS